MVKARVFAPGLSLAGIGQLRNFREREMCASSRFFRWFALGLKRLLESTHTVNWRVLAA